MPVKLYIIGCAGVPARYGGFETFAENLGVQLAHFTSVHIACSTSLYSRDERDPLYNSIHRFFIDYPANGTASLIYDLRALLYAIRHTDPNDCILFLGVTAGVFLPLIRPFTRRRIVAHLDGLEWKRTKWNSFAKLFLRISRRLTLRFSDQLIIDNEALRAYLPVKFRGKAHFITYGGDHLPVEKSSSSPETFEFSLLIARAEPENNLDLIMDTFSGLPDRHLIAITNARSTHHGEYLLKKYADHPNIHFREAIYDPSGILHAYRSFCKVYLHGHNAGGTNPSLVEAMYCGLPAICFENAFNRRTTQNQAVYFSDKASLKESLEAVYQNQHASLGKKLQSIAYKEYIWKRVADDFKQIL